jgi:lysophospholipase L1-like esterase
MRFQFRSTAPAFAMVLAMASGLFGIRPARAQTATPAAVDCPRPDFANLCHYRDENAAVLASGVRPDVVFLGDSITENWKRADPALFNAKVLDRGISGQTTPQILLRFYPDVVALRPRVVHILAGTNDVAGNTGPTSDAAILGNIEAMIDIAKAHRIAVVLSAITPTTGFAMRPGLNRELVRIAHDRKVTFVDYGPVLGLSDGSLNPALGNDGLHPNRDGYKVMQPLADRAIAEAQP